MKARKYNRRMGALERLETQVRLKALSKEFHARIEYADKEKTEKMIIRYWDKKKNEIEHLRKILML